MLGSGRKRRRDGIGERRRRKKRNRRRRGKNEKEKERDGPRSPTIDPTMELVFAANGARLCSFHTMIGVTWSLTTSL